MSITTLDGVIAGMRPPEHFIKVGSAGEGAGIFQSYWGVTGRPSIGSRNGTVNGAVITGPSVAGQFILPSAVGGQNIHLARFAAIANISGLLVLADRLWDNTVTNAAGAQAITTPTWPARDSNGATAGEGVMVGLEFSVASTQVSANTPTLTYTDQSGNAGATATMSPALPTTPAVQSFYPFPLAAGDTGIRAISSFNHGANAQTASTSHLVAYRPIVSLSINGAFIGDAVDALTSGFPRLYDNSAPFLLWLPSGGTATTVTGEVVFTQG